VRAEPESEGAGPDELRRLMQALEPRPVSHLTIHDAHCCRAARAWLTATARDAGRDADNAPTWMCSRWSWGPSSWPLAWCEAVRRRELDCGALAELAAGALEASGRTVCRVQLLISPDHETMAHWRARWGGQKGGLPWIWAQLVYHEAVGVHAGGELRIWDPSAGSWLDPEPAGLTSSVMAMRLGVPGSNPTMPFLRWGNREVAVGRWISHPQG
jgi:hypothetical protein